jgi:hypothetical protein
VSTTIFREAIAEIVSTNPLQTTITFVLADNKPDGNNRVLDRAEFPNVIRSALGMPVKMKFNGFDVENHEGAIPLGAITGVEEKEVAPDHYQLVATAMLWPDEYPEEVKWLKDKYAQGKAPGISYELVYSDAEHEGGLEKIKNVLTAAAAFVKVPAFGKRTPLLALASLMETPEGEQEVNKLLAQIFKVEGGNSMDEKELEALKAKAELAEKIPQLEADAASKDQAIADLQAQLTAKDGELTTANDTIASMQRDSLLNARVAKYTEAGFNLEAEAEKADKRKNYFLSLDDDQFDTYINDLIAAKPAPAAPTGVATASLKKALSGQGDPLPKLDPQSGTTTDTLRAQLRGIARPNSVE